MFKGISPELLKKIRADYNADPKNAIRENATVQSGVKAAASNQKAVIDNPFLFSIELENGDITNQKSSGRCWLFATLNTMRYRIIKSLNLKTFELSQNYQMFWDKMEKANYFLESIIKTANEPLEGRLVNFLLQAPVQDGGQWDMACALVNKYGVVPKYVMPETYSSSNTRDMVSMLTLKLREDAKELREMLGASEESIYARKEEMLSEVYQILSICLGEPPVSFTFEYRDKDDNFFRDENITPKQFFDKYVGQELDDYISIINAPTSDKPYNRTFTVDYLGNVIEGRQVKYLNLTADEMKELAIKQLSDNTPVWFGCDVGKMSTRDTGIMAMNTYNYDELLGVSFGMDKAARLDYASSLMTHAMVFLGVNIDENGKPNRWKVENSWGDTSGNKGIYIMSDEWFTEYNYQVVINKKYLTAEQLKYWEQEPIVLKPWDPMGSLA